MEALAPKVVLAFIAAILGQIVSIGLLPRTNGFSNALPALACVAAFAFSLWMIARLIRDGASLGILIPLSSAIVPLVTLTIGILVYGESVSVSKVGLLIAACVLIGVAARLG